jgi:hypothetical protein
MSDSIVLRKVYALNSNTGLFLSANQILLSDGKGGTQWLPFISSLTSIGGPIIGDLPSTFSTISSQLFSQSNAIIDLQNTVATLELSSVGPLLISTTEGLGLAGYLSSPQLFSTVDGLGNIYPSTASLQSTVIGLGTSGYLSTLSLQSSLQSTVIGLGTGGYVSTSFYNTNLVSSFAGLAGSPYNYVSAPTLSINLISTVAGLSRVGYISTSWLGSTLSNLGKWFSASEGYISTGELFSTTTNLINRPVSFDTTNNVIINSASTVNFNNVSNVYFRSTFITSSLGLIGNSGTEFFSELSTVNSMIFSTAQFHLSSVKDYISTTSKITLEYNPMLLFAKIAATANGPAVLPISTFLQYGGIVLGPMTTNFMFAGFPDMNTYNGNLRFTSTMFQQPIRFEVPLGTMANRSTSNFAFLHMIPNGVNTQTLANSNVTSFFCKNGSSANITVFNTS